MALNNQLTRIHCIFSYVARSKSRVMKKDL